MTRLRPIEPDDAVEKARPLLDAVQRQLGATPNIFRTLAHSPAALDSYLKQTSALAEGSLDPRLREQIALVTAGLNQCDYCASAHSALGRMAGIEDAELNDNLIGRASDATTRAALAFATAIVEKHGRVANSDIEAVRNAGFSEGEVVEIIAVTCMNIFTNYFNHVAGTEIDFPLVSTASLRQAV